MFIITSVKLLIHLRIAYSYCKIVYLCRGFIELGLTHGSVLDISVHFPEGPCEVLTINFTSCMHIHVFGPDSVASHIGFMVPGKQFIHTFKASQKMGSVVDCFTIF